MRTSEIVLPADVESSLRAWARAAYPAEGCGLLIGPWESGSGRVRVVRAVRTRNLAPAGENDRFEVDPADHLRAQREARAAGLDVLGVWHSHPDHPARPSPRDAAGAAAGWSYVIVAVDRGRDSELASFRFHARADGGGEAVGGPGVFRRERIVRPAAEATAELLARGGRG